MDKISKLYDPLLVVKFQRMCGLVPVEERTKSATAETVNICNGARSECINGDYMQQNGKYVLKEVYGLKNNKLTEREDFRNGQLLPPYGQDDSDSDNGVGRGEGQFPFPFEKNLTPHLIKNKFLYYIFRVSSFLGEELFFLTFLPFVAWNMDTVVIRRTVLVWCLCMYTGQAIKDVLRWPRPCAPPVIRLETDFSQEFAMPSTHAMAGTAIPMTMMLEITSRYQVLLIMKDAGPFITH
ncbi:hypothetical protein ACJMK2_023397 [Sinanodonta woodiana]|uniref:Sphingosine-1-phosphate phosphatase 1 n=1 Tax=Sinanodonta woodiana TaxID=1069815 RepID=A0ABD3T435_SINWO